MVHEDSQSYQSSHFDFSNLKKKINVWRLIIFSHKAELQEDPGPPLIPVDPPEPPPSPSSLDLPGNSGGRRGLSRH